VFPKHILISIIGVIIFTGLTAYDTQKIALLGADPRIEGEGSQLAGKLSILGVLFAFHVAWQHPITNAKQQGRKMLPSGG